MKLKHSLSAIAFATLTVSTTLLSATPAKADLTVCNQTSQTMNVAMVNWFAQDWWSRGWYQVNPGGCKTLITGKLRTQDYYLHAHSSDRSIMLEGDTRFCVSHQAFTIKIPHNSMACGDHQERFRRIDTGNSTNYTFRILPPR